jgi:uncharacterized membrane protein
MSLAYFFSKKLNISQCTISQIVKIMNQDIIKKLLQALFIVFIVPAYIYIAFILYLLTYKDYSKSGILSLVLSLAIYHEATANNNIFRLFWLLQLTSLIGVYQFLLA